jgi:hypothetical protein
MDDFVALAEYRRQVSDLYHQLRASVDDAPTRCARFRRSRDMIFANHPLSALNATQRSLFRGLHYFPYNPALVFTAALEAAGDDAILALQLHDDGVTHLRRAGHVRFAVDGSSVMLTVFWITGYGGGLFLPFRDASSGTQTYGGGRYLLDTIKHADLGSRDGCLILDFNFAFNPSCAYDSRWHCPLAPQENWLSVPILAGEMDYVSHSAH